MEKQIKYLELKAFSLNVKIVDTAGISKNLIKRKILKHILPKEKKFNNGCIILFIMTEKVLTNFFINESVSF